MQSLRRIVLCCLALAMMAPTRCVSAEPEAPLSLCVVARAANYHPDVIWVTQQLARELEHWKQPNGGPVFPIVILPRDKENTGQLDIERSGCSYVLEVRYHDSFDWNLPSVPEGMTFPPVSDSDMILYTLRPTDSRKTILDGAIPPPTWKGHAEHPSFMPYPIIAKKVLERIAKYDRLHSPRK